MPGHGGEGWHSVVMTITTTASCCVVWREKLPGITITIHLCVCVCSGKGRGNSTGGKVAGVESPNQGFKLKSS